MVARKARQAAGKIEAEHRARRHASGEIGLRLPQRLRGSAGQRIVPGQLPGLLWPQVAHLRPLERRQLHRRGRRTRRCG